MNPHGVALTRPSTRARGGLSFLVVLSRSLWFTIQAGLGREPSLWFLLSRAGSVRETVRETLHGDQRGPPYFTVILRLDDVLAAYFELPVNRAWKYQVPLVDGEYEYDQ